MVQREGLLLPLSWCSVLLGCALTAVASGVYAVPTRTNTRIFTRTFTATPVNTPTWQTKTPTVTATQTATSTRTATFIPGTPRYQANPSDTQALARRAVQIANLSGRACVNMPLFAGQPNAPTPPYGPGTPAIPAPRVGLDPGTFWCEDSGTVTAAIHRCCLAVQSGDRHRCWDATIQP